MPGRTGAAAHLDHDTPTRWIVLAASLAVAVPSVVAAVRAVRWGWVPVSDQATISTRAAEVLTAHTPRLGQLSGASAQVGLPTRSPGPMGYWPFAVTARWGPLWGSAVVAAVVSGAAMVASVRLAARRGGPALAVAVGVGLVLSARALNPANLASTWNPAVGVMPLVLLVLLAWSVGVGELRLLPVAVLVASFCAQAHPVLLLPAVLVLAVGGAAGLAAPTRRRLAALRDRRWARPGPGARLVLVAAVVGLGCWALPLHEQLTGDPGNLTRLSRADPADPLEWDAAPRVVVDVVGVVPRFLRRDMLPRDHLADVFFGDVPVVSVATTVLVGVGLAGLALRGLRRRQRDLVLAPVLVLALLGAGVVAARATPGETFLVLTYTVWWLIPAGMVAWVVLGWGLARTTGAGAAVARRAPGWAGPLAAGAACLVMVVVGLGAPGQAEPEEPIHDAARAVGDAVVPRVEPGRRYLVVGEGSAGSQLVASTAYRIRRAGGRPIVPGNDGIAAGTRHVPEGAVCSAVVTIGPTGRGASERAAVVAEVGVPARDGSSSDVVVTVGPDDGPPSC